MTRRGFNIGVLTQPPTGDINRFPRNRSIQVPFTNMPGRPVDSMLYMTSAPKKSTATRWAEDWRAAEKRFELDDIMEEKRIQDAGGVVPPSLQLVKKVHVVNMPSIVEVTRRGANTSSGINPNPPPSNDFPGNPPPPHGGSGRKCRNMYGNGYGGGSSGGGGGLGFGGNMPGSFPDVIVDKTNPKSEDVASINPLSHELVLTDRDTIMDEVERVTTKTETKQETKDDLPELLDNPITTIYSPATTAANQVSSLPNSASSVKVESPFKEVKTEPGMVIADRKGKGKAVSPSYRPDYSMYRVPPDPNAGSSGSVQLVTTRGRSRQATSDSAALYGTNVAPPALPDQLTPKIKTESNDLPQVGSHPNNVPMIVTTGDATASVTNMIREALSTSQPTSALHAEKLLPVTTKKGKVQKVLSGKVEKISMKKGVKQSKGTAVPIPTVTGVLTSTPYAELTATLDNQTRARTGNLNLPPRQSYLGKHARSGADLLPALLHPAKKRNTFDLPVPTKEKRRGAPLASPYQKLVRTNDMLPSIGQEPRSINRTLEPVVEIPVRKRKVQKGTK